MSTAIKKVALLGAGGNLGPSILNALLDASFEVTVISRAESKATFPDGVRVAKSDYSLSSLTEIFTGQQAVVSTLGSLAIGQQTTIIDAAVAAGTVARFIPSDFGSNIAKERSRAACPQLFNGKYAIGQYIEKKSAESAAAGGKFSYTSINTGPFFDWGIETGFLEFDVKAKKVVIWDDGERRVSMTTLATIGKAVVGVLAHPEETRNRTIFVASFTTTQQQILAALKKATGVEDWAVDHVKSHEQEKWAQEELSKGNFGAIKAAILTANYSPEDVGSDFEKDEKLENELLGLPKENLEEATKDIVKKIQS